MLDLSSRIYWYCCERYEVFDSGHIPQPYSNNEVLLQISKLEQLDELMFFACLPKSKIYRTCRAILQQLMIIDSSIRLNGRVLQKIETYFSDGFIARIFEAIPEQDLGLASIILATDFDTLFQQFADCIFNHCGIKQLTRTKRFVAGIDNSQLIELSQRVNFIEYLSEILPTMVVASYPLIKKIIKKNINDQE